MYIEEEDPKPITKNRKFTIKNQEEWFKNSKIHNQASRLKIERQDSKIIVVNWLPTTKFKGSIQKQRGPLEVA